MDNSFGTKNYTSFGGNKILQHLDVLKDVQEKGIFRPIMIELCPTEVCDSHCPFCSVSERPVKSSMPFDLIERCLKDFKKLGAKSLEITGGGNPLLYRDKETEHNINSIVGLAFSLGFKIGIITNSHSFANLNPASFYMIDWIRVSLIKLDEGKGPEDYNFCGFPQDRLSFSYILYNGATIESLMKINVLVNLHPRIKFVRIYGDCNIKGGHPMFKHEFEVVANTIDLSDKIFIKDIGLNDSPMDEACYLGAFRPYIAPSPGGGDYHVYPCNSFVLNKRTYDLEYSLGKADEVPEIWERMNKSYKDKGFLYEIKENKGTDWVKTCKFCYFSNTNNVIKAVVEKIDDKEFI